MQPARTPLWQQATALISISTSGAITGLSFMPGPPADLASPASVPVRLLALQQSGRDAPSGDAMLRSAIVNVARHYLRLAAGRTPAEMEAMIWRRASLDGADHGASCAAFASVTLELGARAAGRVSWVTGGPSYPWPLRSWADVRVDENPASPAIVSVLQDAQAHHRWRPLGDGYRPLPGDWVLFGGHVEVVTEDGGGVLRTIGGDSLPDFSVNAHEYAGPLAEHGIQGFVDNGRLPAASSSEQPGPAQQPGSPAADAPGPGVQDHRSASAAGHRDRAAHRHGEHHHGLGAPGRQQPGSGLPGMAAVPGLISPVSGATAGGPQDPADGQPASRSSHEPASASGPAGPPAPQPVGHALQNSPGSAAGHPGPDPGPAPPIPQGSAPADSEPASPLGAASIPGTGVAQPEATAMPGAHAHGAAQHAGDHDPERDSASRPDPPQAAAHRRAAGIRPASQSPAGPAANAAVPGVEQPAETTRADHGHLARTGRPDDGGQLADTTPVPGSAAIPGLAAGSQPASGGAPSGRAGHPPAKSAPAPQARQHTGPPAPEPVAESPAERAFISEIAPGAVAAQRRYGVPASVTIAQAIMESGWGQSVLAARDHNLFGIKGTGPAGSDLLPTREFQSGHWVKVDAGFRVYHNDAESIDDHGRLLATSGFYTGAMQVRREPDAFARALTGVYATDPDYGSQLITLMQRYQLHRFDLVPAGGRPAQPARPGVPAPSPAPAPALSEPAPEPVSPASPASPAPAPVTPPAAPAPALSPSPSPSASASASADPSPSHAAASAGAARPARGPGGPAASTVPSAAARPASRPGQPRRPALYRQPVPLSVRNAFVTSAKVPLIRSEALYRDVAAGHRIAWQLLAACDWMQCRARPGYSPVHGEKLGATNPDGSAYRTKSAALAQCAADLTCLARAVYGIDLTAAGALSVSKLADVFAAFRWGALLRTHSTSAMEFPYSVAGLTAQHLSMRWPAIAAMSAPDKPGSRFRMPFGAVPVVLRLGYPATA